MDDVMQEGGGEEGLSMTYFHYERADIASIREVILEACVGLDQLILGQNLEKQIVQCGLHDNTLISGLPSCSYSCSQP